MKRVGRIVPPNYWLRLDLLLSLIAILVLVWSVVCSGYKVHYGKDFPAFFRILLPLLLAYLLPWLTQLFPSSVVLYSNGIMTTGMKSMLRFKDVTGFSWSQEPTYYVLHLIAKKEPHLLVGVPDPMIRQKINEVLFNAGLKEVPPLPQKRRS